MWLRIRALVVKEILAVWRDKKSRFILIIPPLLQLFIFSFAATLDVKNVPIGVVNYDQGEKSFELLQRFHGSRFFTNIHYLQSVNEAKNFLDNMRGLMVVVIDEQFSRNLEAHKQADVLLLLDGRKSNTTQIVAGYTSSIVDQYNHDFAAKAHLKQQHSRIVFRSWFNPNLIYFWYNVPALAGILTMLVALIVTGLSVAREKELGTFDQLLVSPLVPTEILIGKTVPALLIGMAEGAFIVFAGIGILGVPFHGSMPLLFIGMFVYITAIIGIGLFISALSQTQQQAVLGTYIFMSPSVLLSGFATPVENMPVWLQPVADIIPLKFFLIIAKGLFLKDIDAWIVFQNIWPMMIIAAVTLLGSGWFFRRNLE